MYICDALHDLVSVTIWHWHDCLNFLHAHAFFLSNLKN